MSEGSKLNIDEIRTSLKSLNQANSFSVLPDFFLDRFVRVDSIDGFFNAIKNKSKEGGGGSLRGISQFEAKGGNAVNLAYALGKLGVRVHLLTIAESIAADTLRSTFRAMGNVSLDLIEGKNGLTIAIEFLVDGRRVNVMASETGDVQDFDGISISSDAWNRITDAKIVSVVNWAANNKGTDLCERAYSLSKRKKNSTFLDPADVSQLQDKIPDLKKRIFDRGLLDRMSLNDNELRIFLRVLGTHVLPQEYSDTELINAVRTISDICNLEIDLHTRKLSVTCKERAVETAKCHEVEQRIVTGAGDVWDAADLIGHALNWTPELRLRFANAAAGLYVSKQDAEPPSLEEILEFIQNEEKDYH